MASFYYNEKHTMQIIPDETDIYKITKKKVIKINGVNTWKDWHLIPASRPIFNSPKVKTNYIDLPGANGSIDATQVLSNYIYYNNREGSNEFYVANGFGDWAERFSEIMNYLHGRKVKVILSDDPGFYYRGRLAVNQWKSEKDFSKIVIDYVLEPYKYEILSTNDDWLWDPFNFYTGIIRNKSNYTDVIMNGPLEYTIDFYPRAMPVVPVITVTTTWALETGSTPSGSGESSGTTTTSYDAETLQNYKLAFEVVEGKWGDGEERIQRLSSAGYDYQTIQDIVNVCYEVDDGLWGEKKSTQQQTDLENAGYVFELIWAVIDGSYSGEWDPDGEFTPTPDPEPTPTPTTYEMTIMTATAKGKKGVKRTITLPAKGKTRTYRYPDLVISEKYPKLVFTPDNFVNTRVSIYYRGGML